MRNRLYIFSSRLAGSALVWVVALIVAIEAVSARKLPARYKSHEVDQLLYELDHAPCSAPVIVLGDSIGRQIGLKLQDLRRGAVLSLACNAAIETPGQYYIFRRYAARNPPPKKVLLIMACPAAGNLNNQFTENFVQRCFLRWPEITGLAAAKKDPAFTTMMAAYKIFPSLRYRLHLQKKLPGLKTSDIYSGLLDLSVTPKTPAYETGHGLIRAMHALFTGKTPGPDIAQAYLSRLVEELAAQNIGLTFVFPPFPDSHRASAERMRFYKDQFRLVGRLAEAYPAVKAVNLDLSYPDDWFADGVHLKQEHVRTAAEKYLPLLDDTP